MGCLNAPLFYMTQNRSIVKGTEILGSPGSTNLPVDNKYGSTIMEDNLDWVVFGSDNLFPQAIAYLNRKAAVHRGILNNKTTYITGKGLICDEKEKELAALLLNANAEGESLRKVYKRKVYDKQSYVAIKAPKIDEAYEKLKYGKIKGKKFSVWIL